MEGSNDTLTLALGDQEHTRCVRGMRTGVIYTIFFFIPLYRTEDPLYRTEEPQSRSTEK